MFCGSKKTSNFSIYFSFASEMEYCVSARQRYIEGSSQLLSTVRKVLAKQCYMPTSTGALQPCLMLGCGLCHLHAYL